jgi:hypothetical protein
VKNRELNAGAGAINVDAFKPEQGYVLCLKSLPPTLEETSGFKWPEKGRVAAPDWKRTKSFGNGLHAFLWGDGGSSVAYVKGDARWLVLKVRAKDVIDLGCKVKFPEAEVLFCGEKEIAVSIVMHHAPVGTAVMFANVMGGNGATLVGGYRSTVKGGNGASVTGGKRAKVTGGDFATVKGGDFATVIGGKYANVTGGYCSTVKGGDYATITGGIGASVTGGISAKVMGGDRSTVTGGHYANVMGGHFANVRGGDFATVSGGIGARVSGGYGAVLILEYSDENKINKKVFVVDGEKILPYVKYRLNKKHELVRAD